MSCSKRFPSPTILNSLPGTTPFGPTDDGAKCQIIYAQPLRRLWGRRIRARLLGVGLGRLSSAKALVERGRLGGSLTLTRPDVSLHQAVVQRRVLGMIGQRFL